MGSGDSSLFCLSAVFYGAHRTTAYERKSWGRIINIASVHGLAASVNKAAYCAAKGGVCSANESNGSLLMGALTPRQPAAHVPPVAGCCANWWSAVQPISS